VKGETTAAGAGGATAHATTGLSAVGALVRRHDRDRYQTALFAPDPARREALFALYAFNREIARVRESVTQPMLGQIRLQWWREVIEAAFAGAAARAHEVAVPLTEAIRAYGLSRAYFDRMIDARELDLSDEPPRDMTALEEYAEGTSANLVRLALEVCGNSSGTESDRRHLAGSVGIGYALAGLLRAMPFHANIGRSYIPAEVAARVGLDPADYAALRCTPAMQRAVSEVAAAADRHLEEAQQQFRTAPPAVRPPLLPAIAAARCLARLRGADHDPFAPELRKPDTLLSWRLTWAMLAGRW